jgi:hypothetical protein
MSPSAIFNRFDHSASNGQHCGEYRSCVLELCVVALPLLRIFVSVLASENFLSKSSLFNLSASNGQHCGEYRVIYHKNNGDRFFLSFEAKYPNPEPKKGKCSG